MRGRKIPLVDVQKRLLEEYEKGLVRDHSYAQYDKVTIEEITNVLEREREQQRARINRQRCGEEVRERAGHG